METLKAIVQYRLPVKESKCNNLYSVSVRGGTEQRGGHSLEREGGHSQSKWVVSKGEGRPNQGSGQGLTKEVGGEEGRGWGQTREVGGNSQRKWVVSEGEGGASQGKWAGTLKGSGW